MEWIYHTNLEKTECVERLLNLQEYSEEDLNPAYVECTRLSDSQLYFVYKGRRFSKARRSEFIVTITPGDDMPDRTRVIFTFSRELLRLPWPMTSAQELDILMEEKLNAYRLK